MTRLALADLQGDATPKVQFAGGARTCAPAETFERFRKLMPQMGITRLADLTGLDSIRLPTFQSVRPMARSLSVNQGKGIDSITAKVSALMEAAETWHAENPVQAVIHSAQDDLPAHDVRFDLAAMAVAGVVPAAQLPREAITWVAGTDLITGGSTYVPADCVLMDYAAQPSSRFLRRSSNGLASGNTATEATVSALLEVIERDCTADFKALDGAGQAARKLRASQVSVHIDPLITNGLQAAGTQVQVWDITNDIGIPAFYAILTGGCAPFSRQVLRGFAGAGCHLDPTVALSRAVCEAVQSRLTVISGARDDLGAVDYEPAATTRLAQMTSLFFEAEEGRDFSAQTKATTSASGDFARVMAALWAVGVTQVMAVDLTHPDKDLPVVRVVAPGLGHPAQGETMRLGERHLFERVPQ